MNNAIFTPLMRMAWERAKTSPYAIALALFLAMSAVFVLGVWAYWSPTLSACGVDGTMTAFFICSVHALLFVNTISFLVHVTPIISNVQTVAGIPSGEQKIIRSTHGTFIFCLIISVFMSGGVSVLVILVWFGVIPHQKWWAIVGASEAVSLAVFVLFLVGDFCCLEVGLRALRCITDAPCLDRGELEKLVRTLKHYILGVDAPGVLGLLAILLFSIRIRHMSHYPWNVPVSYWEGFVAGAVGLHVMFSQASLAFLSIIDHSHAVSVGNERPVKTDTVPTENGVVQLH